MSGQVSEVDYKLSEAAQAPGQLNHLRGPRVSMLYRSRPPLRSTVSPRCHAVDSVIFPAPTGTTRLSSRSRLIIVPSPLAVSREDDALPRSAFGTPPLTPLRGNGRGRTPSCGTQEVSGYAVKCKSSCRSLRSCASMFRNGHHANWHSSWPTSTAPITSPKT